jgi:hypothetical protein
MDDARHHQMLGRFGAGFAGFERVVLVQQQLEIAFTGWLNAFAWNVRRADRALDLDAVEGWSALDVTRDRRVEGAPPRTNELVIGRASKSQR